MAVTVTNNSTRGITGAAHTDDTVRSREVTAELTFPAGPYAKGGYPVTAQQFGLRQLRDMRAEATDRYWFAFELAGYRTADEDSTRGVLRVFQGSEVEDGTELPEITTLATAEGI